MTENKHLCDKCSHRKRKPFQMQLTTIYQQNVNVVLLRIHACVEMYGKNTTVFKDHRAQECIYIYIYPIFPNTCGLTIVATMQHETLCSHIHVKWLAPNLSLSLASFCTPHTNTSGYFTMINHPITSRLHPPWNIQCAQRCTNKSYIPVSIQHPK